jgi:hypothetical protein
VEVLNELGLVAGFGALKVGVLNPQDELTASAPGDEPVVECGASIADVQKPGGGRGKADAGNLGIHDSYP